MTESAHIIRIYDDELHALREKLLAMGSLVEQMMSEGEGARHSRDTEQAQATMRLDRRINRLECEADGLAMRMLAMRQPVASDLRFITAALKLVTDLERMGDLCVNICERVIELNDEPPLPDDGDLVSLSKETASLVHDALEALSERDVDKATAVLDRDGAIDEHYARIFGELLKLMGRQPSTVFRATRIQSIAKYLERIADHAVNVAEIVVFIVHGTDVRHRDGSRQSSPDSYLPSQRQ